MVSFKTIFAYIIFALAAVVLFLYLLFPDQAVKAYMDNRLAAIEPSLTMTAETMRPTLSPGLKMTGVDLNRDSVRLAHFTDARVAPDLMTLLKGNKQARFQARLADGTIQGRAVMAGSGATGQLQVEADLSQIRIEQIDGLKVSDRFTLSGILKGHVTHNGDRSPAGATSGRLTVSGLRIALKAALFGISELVMDGTDMEFSTSRQSLRIKTLTFNGPMLEGKITGTIGLKHPFGKSRLNLTGNAKPQPELFARLQETIPPGIVNTQTLGTRGLTFTVRGSIDNPDVSMR
jgi:type II secretion system protein N